MTVSYQVDRETSLIRTRCVGEVTFAEVADHFRELERDASLPARLDVLLDLTEMQSIPDSDQLKTLAGKVEQLQGKLTWGSCAIVADRDVLYGMSRIFQIFVEAHFVSARVFRKLDEAELWLSSARSPTA